MEKVFITDNIDEITNSLQNNHLSHFYCLEGSCTFFYYGNTLTLSKGECMILILGRCISDVRPSDDFRVKIISVDNRYLASIAPSGNNYAAIYGIKGLYFHPIMHLSENDSLRCRSDFEQVEMRIGNTSSAFFEEALGLSLRVLFLDFFDFHSKGNPVRDISDSNADIYSRFMALLSDRSNLKNHNVADYADILCITPKYLSAVVKNVSGHSAQRMIDVFLTNAIRESLENQDIPLVDIAEEFGFSSFSYFSKYVSKHFGVSPSKFRR